MLNYLFQVTAPLFEKQCQCKGVVGKFNQRNEPGQHAFILSVKDSNRN